MVVPAHNEAALLPGCLAALHEAAGGGPDTALIVVADACDDATAAVAERAGAAVVRVDVRNVGRARAAGMAFALRHGPEGLWLATTDADTRVPADWLAWHRRHARAGVDVLAGTVTVTDWTARPAHLRERFEAEYRQLVSGSGHGHVHGANLGCAASAYALLGGFAPVPHGEDHDLITRARRAGLRVVTDVTCPVTTSARPHGRAPLGFAGYLDALADR